MSERLRLLGADLDAVRWDAHRTEDGTWQVRAAWRAGHKSGTTRWSYDIPARTVTPFDATTMDFAEGTRLVRVVPDVPVGLPAAPISRRAVAAVRRRRARRRRRPGAGTDRTTTWCATSSPPTATRSTSCSPATTPDPPPSHRAAYDDRPYDASPYDDVDPDTQDTVVLGRPTARSRTPAPASRRGRTSSSGSAGTADGALGVNRSELSGSPLACGGHDRPHRRPRRPGAAVLAGPALALRPALPRAVALTFTGALLATLAQLVVPLVTQAVVDGPIAPPVTGAGLVPLFALALVFGIAEAALFFLRRWAMGISSLQSSATCATPSTSGCSGCRSPSTSWSSGQLLSRATTDVSTVRRFVGFGAVFLVVNLITCAVVRVLLLVTYWPLGVAVLVTTLPWSCSGCAGSGGTTPSRGWCRTSRAS